MTEDPRRALLTRREIVNLMRDDPGWLAPSHYPHVCHNDPGIVLNRIDASEKAVAHLLSNMVPLK